MAYIIHQQQKLTYDIQGNGTYPIIIFHGLINIPLQPTIIESLTEHNLQLITLFRSAYAGTTLLNSVNILEASRAFSPVIDALNLQQFSVLGLSAGAPYAYAMASLYPQQCENIFITSGIPAVDKKVIFKTYSLINRLLYRFINICPTNLLKKMLLQKLNLTKLKQLLPDSTQQEIIVVQQNIVQDMAGIIETAKLQRKPWGFNLEDIKQAVYLAHGSIDSEVPIKVALTSSQLLKNPHFEILQNEGHVSDTVLNTTLQQIIANTQCN